MKRTAFVMALAAVLASPLVAQDTAIEKTEQETVSAIIQAHEKAMQDFMAKVQAETDQDKVRDMVLNQNPTPAFAARMFKAVAGKEATDEGFKGLDWIIANGQPKDGGKAMGLVAKHHIGHADVGRIVGSAAGMPSKGAVDFLSSVLAKSEDRNVKGQACWGLSQVYGTLNDFKGYLKDEEAKAQITAMFGQKTVDYVMGTSVEANQKAAAKYLRRVAREFADVPSGRRGTLGEMARSAIFELENLSVGKTAPEIDGEDIDGVAFKLSDYRGKVVMLDFWGDW